MHIHIQTSIYIYIKEVIRKKNKRIPELEKTPVCTEDCPICVSIAPNISSILVYREVVIKSYMDL